ncbi:MAG: hypothetical protein IJX77_10300 [Ruminococcus sp.]|nr:hypothetical protein [Ruminococcus sp.]
MKSINFNTGERTYIVNEDESKVIRINLSDINLMKRINETQKQIQHLSEKYRDTKKPSFEEIKDINHEIRRIFNYAFGTDICTPAFGDANVMSPVDGKPLFQVFFDAFLPVLREDLKTVAPKKMEIKPEVQKYLDKPEITVSKPIAAFAQPYSQGLDVSTLSKEQKAALIAQLLS